MHLHLKRTERIAKNAKGFVYLVSSLGVTGVRQRQTDIKGMAEKIKEHTDIPVAVGFGISKGEQAKDMVQYADSNNRQCRSKNNCRI